MYESKSDKRAVTTAAKKVTKTKAAPKSGQDIADEIMRLNAVHGHPSVQVNSPTLRCHPFPGGGSQC